MTLFLLILGAISAMALGALLLYKITYCFCKHLSKFLNRKKKNEHKESEYCWKPGVTEISMGDWKLSEKGKMLKIKEMNDDIVNKFYPFIKEASVYEQCFKKVGAK